VSLGSARNRVIMRSVEPCCENSGAVHPEIEKGSRNVRPFLCLPYRNAHGLRPSMSRAGTPYDNAKCERFIKTLKYEEVYVKKYESVSDARRSIGHFVEIVYNRRKRLHSALGYVPPAEFEHCSSNNPLNSTPA
jgi:transposase InsO family protein